MQSFDFHEAPELVTIDVSQAHIWDISAVAALDMVVLKFRREGSELDLIGMNSASRTIVDKLALHDKNDEFESLLEH